MKRDGHIHSPFCPHGTKDSLSSYVEQAIRLGFQEITFAEHAPLPNGFVDTTPTKDSAMSRNTLDLYIREVKILKKAYQKTIKINLGLEVDYVEGYDKEITELLNEIGPELDDSILSVHFLQHKGHYDCLDYSSELFGEMINKYGSLELVYEKYYSTLLQSIHADLGIYKPKRIGHISLVHKFQHQYPRNCPDDHYLTQVLDAIKENGLELDYNGAGLSKPLCLETYPPSWVVREAQRLGIPLVYGSDAHQTKDLGQGYNQLLLKN